MQINFAYKYIVSVWHQGNTPCLRDTYQLDVHALEKNRRQVSFAFQKYDLHSIMSMLSS